MEDEKIMDLYWQREESAVAETAKKYGHYCQTIAYNILNDYEDAMECENDAYIALWNTIPPKRPLYFKAFLASVVRNISFSKYDYNSAKKRNSRFDLVLSELEECLVTKEDVASSYEEGEIATYISDYLKTLEKTKRQVFVRRYYYSDSIAMISRQFGISESKVKSMLFRIRNNLRRYLEKEGVWI